MYKAKFNVLGIDIEFDTQDEKELWKRLALFHGIPPVCPIDDTPVRFFHKAPEGNDYFEVRNTGALLFECAFGQYKDKSGLFPKGVWSWWDWENKQDVVLYENGKLTEAGLAMRKRCLSRETLPAPTGIHADDNPANYPQSLDEVPELAGGTVPAPAAQGNHRKPGQVATAQLNIIHALGMALYNFDKATWDAKRPGLSKTFSKGRTESSSELWVAEAAAMQAKLEEKVRGNYEQAAQDLMQSGKVTPFELSDIDELHGVELANAYRALCAKASAQAANQKVRNSVAAIRN